MQLRRDVKMQLISHVALFAGCSKKELAYVASLADEIDVPEGKTIIREGDVGHEFFVVAAGNLRVSRDGRKLRDLGPGDWAGEIALLSDVPRTATVITTSPSRLLVLTDRHFKQLVESSPSIAVKVLRTLGERLHELKRLT
jgi:CRP/FNR family cyclic AMP-dependent transcriptional regulator